MNKIKQTLFWCIAFTVFSVFQIGQTFAQQNITVKGKVIDDKNEPLIGVSVGITGGKGGTRTDINGDFQLSVPATTKSLKFSYIGFDNKTVLVTANMNVLLKTATNTLDDVVVTGYSTVKKKDLTGAVSNITSKDFNQGNVTNSIMQIQGKVAGLSIVKSSGDANETPTIRLRGQTSLFGNQSPLIVVDGVQLNGVADLNLIPPGDIASYDVLKDASATSVYGSRGANGVIIVTTKRGISGQTRVDYQGVASLDVQARYVDLLSADKWRAAQASAGIVSSQFDQGGNTNWQKEMTRQALTQNHTVSLSGGAKGFNYRGSINYIGQNNIIINSGREQIGIRFNAQQKALNDKLDLQLSIANSITNQNNINYGATYAFIADVSPALPVYNADRSYNKFYLDQGGMQNRVMIQNEKLSKNRQNFTQYAGSAKYEILSGLKAGVAGTFITNVNSGDNWFPQFATEQLNSAKKETSTTDNYRGEINLSFDKSYGKHNISALGLYEYQFFTNNSFNSEARNILFPFFKNNALEISTRDNRNTSSFRAENKLISLLGQFNYNYDNRYYATLSLRRDGSTKFGVNKKWGTFGAANFAWRITQEKFMKDVTWLNDLKLRFGYGEVGNSDGLSEYNSLRLRSFGGIFNNVVNFTITQNENPNLQWEVRRGRNVGLDFALFNSRLSGDINYFNDITDKLLYTYEVASGVPVPNRGTPDGKFLTANVGKLTNKGLELSLNFRAIENKDFQWTIGGQVSGVRTKIVTLEDPSGKFALRTPKIIAGSQNLPGGSGAIPITYLAAGSAPFIFELPYFTGLDTAGNQQFLQKARINAAGDTTMVNETRMIDATPRFNYGISNSFTYKNINLSFFLRGVSGIKIYNSFASIVESDVDGRLSRGYNTTQAGLDGGINDGVAISDRWLENASFIRLDNASLGYTFKKIKGFQSLKVFLAGNNLFVITKYKGIDPEVQTSGAISAGSTGDNYLDYNLGVPRIRSFSFGLNATF